MSAFYDDFLRFAQGEYASLRSGEATLSPLLLSPHRVEISANELDRIARSIRAFFALRQRAPYIDHVRAARPGLGRLNHRNFSVLMSYDFHLTPNGPKLIEINTNASFSLGVDLLNRFHGDNPPWLAFRARLLDSFRAEYASFGGPGNPARLALVDEGIPAQRMFPEFKMFEEFLGRSLCPATLCEPADLELRGSGLVDARGERVDFVYNRLTDFFLERFPHLERALGERSACFSPNPLEYALLADKGLLAEWSTEFFAAMGLSAEEGRAAAGVLEPVKPVSAFATAEELWAERKQFYFKPRSSFGGKAVYPGESVRRKVFDEILRGDYVVQRAMPAPLRAFRSGDLSEEFRFDLRCYVYRDEIQLMGARLFRGATTNFRTPNGGYAAVRVLP